MQGNVEINFNNSSIFNAQIGNKNKMYMNNNSHQSAITEKHWEEIDSILNKKLMTNTLSESQSMLTNNALEYVEKRDEQGFRKFWVSNKDNFLTNLFSNLASSGLLELLNHL